MPGEPSDAEAMTALRRDHRECPTGDAVDEIDEAEVLVGIAHARAFASETLPLLLTQPTNWRRQLGKAYFLTLWRQRAM